MLVWINFFEKNHHFKTLLKKQININTNPIAMQATTGMESFRPSLYPQWYIWRSLAVKFSMLIVFILRME